MFSLQCLSNGKESGAPSISLSYHSVSVHSGKPSLEPSTHFLFNVGEGFQRICAEVRFKVKLVRGVFLTQLTPSNFGGLSGLHFSLAEAGTETLQVRGPSGCKQVVESCGQFVRRRWPEVNTKDLSVSQERAHKGHANAETVEPLLVVAVTLLPTPSNRPHKPFCYSCATSRRSSSTESSDEGSCSSSSDGESVANNSRSSSDGESVASNASSSSDDGTSCNDGNSGTSRIEKPDVLSSETHRESMCYIIHSKNSLSAGSVVVIDCPTVGHVSNMVTSPHLKFNCQSHPPVLIVHMSHSKITSSERYQVWLSSVTKPHPNVRHIYVHQSHLLVRNTTFKSAEKQLFALQEAARPLFWTADEHVLPNVASSDSQGFPIGSCVETWSITDRPVGKLKVHLLQTDTTASHSSKLSLMEGCTKGTEPRDPDEIDIEDEEVDQESILDEVTNNKRDFNPDEIDIEDDKVQEQPNAVQVDRTKHPNQEGTDINNSNSQQIKQGNKQSEPENKKVCLANYNQVPELSGQNRNQPGLTFLGTGAARPSKWRGCSSIYVGYGTRYQGALLDVGEGALGQLERKYGFKEAMERVANLDFIWISHSHVDHHGGLLRIIETFVRENRTDNVLRVVGPDTIQTFLQSALSATLFQAENQGGSSGHRIQFVHCSLTRAYGKQFLGDIVAGGVVAGITTCKVHHCFDAFAIALDIVLPPNSLRADPNQRPDVVPRIRVVYSGDTRPCNQLVQLARGPWRNGIARSAFVNLMIHEATFEDELLEHAKRKRHSTVGEALSIIKQSGCDLGILTHLSQRYSGTVSASGTIDPLNQVPFIVASDLLSVPLDTPHDIVRYSNIVAHILSNESQP